MRKWLSIGLVIVVALSLVIGILSPAVVSAKEKSATDTVTAYVKALPNLKKTAVTAGYWVTDQEASVKGKLDAIPKDTKITIKLVGKLKTTGQDGGPATVTGTYKVDLQYKKQKQSLGQKTITFTLEKKGDPKKYPWLISNCDLDLASLKVGTPTATPTPSPTSAGPVKIGAIMPWSGPAALAGLLGDGIIKEVEWQVQQMGGILGGRQVRFVKYDNRATVAEAVAGAKKLILEDKVSALVWGGTTGAEEDAVSDVAEKNNTLFVTMGQFANLNAKNTIAATFPDAAFVKPTVDLATKVLNAKTVAYFGNDLSDNHRRAGLYKSGLVAAGLKWGYEEYAPPGTTDLTPYLTKIKYINPDLLILDSGLNDFVQNAASQIMDLGGWGNIRVVGLPTLESAMKLPGAQGWYILAAWVTSMPNEASRKFQQDYQTVNGSPLMSPAQIYYYNAAIIAIKAIEMAGTDNPAKVVAFVQTGKLEVDTPMGFAKFTLENKGYGGLYPSLTQVQGKKEILVTIPQ